MAKGWEYMYEGALEKARTLGNHHGHHSSKYSGDLTYRASEGGRQSRSLNGNLCHLSPVFLNKSFHFLSLSFPN